MAEAPQGLRAVRRFLGMLRNLSWSARVVAIQRVLESDRARQHRLHEAFSSAPARVVFVCHGNIMRSAFAVAYLHAHHPLNANRIAGAGTHATTGRAAQDSARRVANDMRCSLDAHTAQSLADVRLAKNDVVVCMDRANEANVCVHGSAQKRRVFLVGDIEPHASVAQRMVRDPYGRGDQATHEAFRRISNLAEQWYERAHLAWAKVS